MNPNDYPDERELRFDPDRCAELIEVWDRSSKSAQRMFLVLLAERTLAIVLRDKRIERSKSIPPWPGDDDDGGPGDIDNETDGGDGADPGADDDPERN